MKKQFILFFLIALTTLSYSQKKKEVKKYHIKSVTSTDTENGKTVTDSKTVFGTNGEPIEEVNYDKTGLIKSTIKYKYNSCLLYTSRCV